MNSRLVLGMPGLLALLSLGVVACGSDGPPATAEPGSKFCDLAQEARDAGDAVDVSGSPDDFEDQVAEALTASKAAAAVAPKDFEDIADDSIEAQEAFIEVLEEYDYDFVAASTSDEGAELLEDERFNQAQEDRDEYLSDKCDIEETVNTVGGDLSFDPGDEGIRQLFELLQLNSDLDLTDDQVDCAVEALSGNISDEDVQAIANQGSVSDEAAVVFAQAVSDCGIELT